MLLIKLKLNKYVYKFKMLIKKENVLGNIMIF